MSIEKLAYRTIEQDRRFELRLIAPHVMEETFVGGEFGRIGNEGFRRLIEYPGGANRIRARISMTAPVFQESASGDIAMTPPVVDEEVGDRYRTTFLVPSKYALETLQQPTDPRIRSRAEPARSVAAPCPSCPSFIAATRSRSRCASLVPGRLAESRANEPSGTPIETSRQLESRSHLK